MAACHGARTRRQILAGGAKRPPETPRPRRGRQPAPQRPCEATPAAPPATRARSDLAQARHGADAGGRGLRAWRRAPGGAPPACGGWHSPSRIGRPVSAPASAGTGPASRSVARPQRVGGALRRPPRCQITEAPGRRPGPAGALPLDPARGSPLDPTEGAPIGAPSDRCGSPPKRAAGLSEASGQQARAASTPLRAASGRRKRAGG